MQTAESCATCRFFDGVTLCRRSPPVLVPGINGGHSSEWPLVTPIDWCGEFQPPAKDR